MHQMSHWSRFAIDTAAAAMTLPARMDGGGETPGFLIMPSATWALRPTIKLTAALPVFLGSYAANPAAAMASRSSGT